MPLSPRIRTVLRVLRACVPGRAPAWVGLAATLLLAEAARCTPAGEGRDARWLIAGWALGWSLAVFRRDQ